MAVGFMFARRLGTDRRKCCVSIHPPQQKEATAFQVPSQVAIAVYRRAPASRAGNGCARAGFTYGRLRRGPGIAPGKTPR